MLVSVATSITREPMPTSDTETPPPFAAPAAGYLLTPLAWMRAELAPMIAREPRLAVHLTTLDRARMHVVAFALAHVRGTVTPAFVEAILTAPRRTVLAAALGVAPPGLRRVFERMPYRVLPRASYFQLSTLSVEPRAMKLLAHAAAVDETLLALLSALPPALRSPAILRLRERCAMLDGLPESLRFLAARGAIPDLDAMIDRLGHCRSPREFAALVRTAADALPLPDALPPRTIGRAVRVDDARAIRDLARRWRNCLATYLGGINDGEYAFYLWQADGLEAGIMLRRRGRLGWFIHEVKGPRNREPLPPAMAAILAAFAGSGIPQDAVAELISDIAGFAEEPPPRRARAADAREAEDAGIADDAGQDEPDLLEEIEAIDWQGLDDLLCASAWDDDDVPMAEAA